MTSYGLYIYIGISEDNWCMVIGVFVHLYVRACVCAYMCVHPCIYIHVCA